MICPNLSNPQVRQEFEELKSVLGENMAYLVWNRNNGFHLDKAPNGKPSKLFDSLLSLTDRQTAIEIKAKTLSQSFKQWFGDSKVVDENNEPIIENNTINNEVELKQVLPNITSRYVDNIYNSTQIKTENHTQTKIDENRSMYDEVLNNFETYFPDYDYFTDEQRKVVAQLVESGKLQISCSI